MTLTARIARRLRYLADRIDPRGATRFTHWSFTMEDGEGMRFREDGRGCPVAYYGEDHYERAHAEADSTSESAAMFAEMVRKARRA